MLKVCFVCLGNICRSPTAEGVFHHLVAREGLENAIEIDSAGTSSYHIGATPDKRSAAVAERRGFKLMSRARQFTDADFAHFDYILAMDQANLEELVARAPHDAARAKVHLLRAFDPSAPQGAEVPDPYFGGPQGFEEVLDICVRGCEGLLEHLRRHDLATRKP